MRFMEAIKTKVALRGFGYTDIIITELGPRGYGVCANDTSGHQVFIEQYAHMIDTASAACRYCGDRGCPWCGKDGGEWQPAS